MGAANPSRYPFPGDYKGSKRIKWRNADRPSEKKLVLPPPPLFNAAQPEHLEQTNQQTSLTLIISLYFQTHSLSQRSQGNRKQSKQKHGLLAFKTNSVYFSFFPFYSRHFLCANHIQYQGYSSESYVKHLLGETGYCCTFHNSQDRTR